MKFELFVANKIRLDNSGNNRSAVSALNVAIVGMILAIVIMVVSVSVVAGFKQTITSKIENLDSHIKIYNQWADESGVIHNSISCSPSLDSLIHKGTDGLVISSNLVSEIPCVLKTDSSFAGLRFKGIRKDFDMSFLQKSLVSGRADIAGSNVLISDKIASKLSLKTGDRMSVYFMNGQNIKVRKCNVSGIYNTDFESFDNYVMIGDLSTLQSVNRWDKETATYMDVTCSSLDDVENVRNEIINRFKSLSFENQTDLTGSYIVSTIYENNPSLFAWLDLLDTNIAVVLGLMAFVASFAIIACLIIVVLNKINVIGVLKALGMTTGKIQLIFIMLVSRIVIRSVIIGNGLALGVLLIQRHFHLIKLDAESYFMSYVPVEIDERILLINLGFVIIAVVSMWMPSFIISGVTPSKSINFE